MMKNIIEKTFVSFIYLFCLIVVVELGVNYFSFKFLFPVKNAVSYGYVAKKSNKTIIPLNKYSTRLKAQIALPYELIRSYAISEKDLILVRDEQNKKYGYVDSDNNVIID